MNSELLEMLSPLATLNSADGGASREDESVEMADQRVLGVRETKNDLSGLLNRASNGDVIFIEAGGGGTAVLVGAEALAGVLQALKRGRSRTLGETIRNLPFPAAQFTGFKLSGRPPRRNFLKSEA